MILVNIRSLIIIQVINLNRSNYFCSNQPDFGKIASDILRRRVGGSVGSSWEIRKC